MQVGMHPGTEFGMIILAAIVGSFPIAVGIVPEGLDDEGEVGGD